MSGTSSVLSPGDGGKLLRGELAGWTGHDFSQIELARQSPALRNQGIDIYRLKKAVQFLLGLKRAAIDELLGQFLFGLAGPEGHEHEHRQGTQQDEDHEAPQQAPPNRDGFTEYAHVF